MNQPLSFILIPLLFLSVVNSAPHIVSQEQLSLPITISKLPCEPIACLPLQCPKGTQQVLSTKGCACPECQPISVEAILPPPVSQEASRLPTSLPKLPCEPMNCPPLQCPEGTQRVTNTRGCKCPECQPISIEGIVSSLPCRPLACLPVKCEAGKRLITVGCECPKCVPNHGLPPLPPPPCKLPKFCPAIACTGTFRLPSCGCPVCVPLLEKTGDEDIVVKGGI